MKINKQDYEGTLLSCHIDGFDCEYNHECDKCLFKRYIAEMETLIESMTECLSYDKCDHCQYPCCSTCPY